MHITTTSVTISLGINFLNNKQLIIVLICVELAAIKLNKDSATDCKCSVRVDMLLIRQKRHIRFFCRITISIRALSFRPPL